ncbi:MAG: fucose isomerase [Clostridia bacterium]|nr:fucose isomerase [Clostridia bacterium]
MSFECAYIPIGVGTFHLESAKSCFDKSVDYLRSLDAGFKAPSDMLLTIDALDSYLETIKPDFAVVQNLTFANAAYMCEILKKIDCPVLLWTLREPVIDGTRLRLNSLTGAFSAANSMRGFGKTFEYVFGSPDEDKVKSKIKSVYAAAKLVKSFKSLKLLQVGHTPQGFGFGRALDLEALKTFGVTVNSIEARELIDKAKTFTDEDIVPYLDDAKKRICGLDSVNEKNVRDFARLYKAYYEYVKAEGIGALASRCWPDFFTSFGTPVCSVLGILNDLNVPAACESDAYGALTMYAANQLTGKAAFFGDPVSLDEKENTLTFWHCGMAPCSLAREDTGACAGLHCNRKIGPTLEFGCKAEEKVTIFRIGRNPDGTFRFFLTKGRAVDKPKQFSGTSIVVETESSSAEIIDMAVRDGWEPHFAVAMGDITSEIEALGNFIGIEVCRY